METEHSNDKLTILQRSTPHFRWIGEQLTILAEAMGENLTQARLKIYAEDLSDLSQEQLRIAFVRARRELKFFPKVAELRELAGAGQAEQQDAEGRLAWQVVTGLLDRHVRSDVHGGYHLVADPYGKGWKLPELSERVLAAVRRVGGWQALKCMSREDYPFVQKRFFEEYRACEAVERVDPKKLLQHLAGELTRGKTSSK